MLLDLGFNEVKIPVVLIKIVLFIPLFIHALTNVGAEPNPNDAELINTLKPLNTLKTSW